MNEIKFNSQICTTKEQSQRLLDLGLKPETADMVLLKELAYDEVAHCIYDADTYMIRPIDYLVGEKHRGYIPAWSLHRLLCMLDYDNTNTFDIMPNFAYEDVITTISGRISCRVFNKEYLK